MKRLFTAMLVCALMLYGCGTAAKEVYFGDHRFEVELAVTPKQRARGLMFRKKLDEDKGMLFIFEEEGIHPFWMKNTFIPLDIIWADKNKKVVFIKRDAQPCKDGPCSLAHPTKKAKYVLEVNGGIAGRIGLGVGDSLAFDIK